jgi:dihydrofolate reductase
MRKVIVSEYVTLDGVMDEPGRWSGPFWSDEASDFKHNELFASDALLLGRVTYEGFAKAWPSMEGTEDYGERMNSLPKYVASTTLHTPAWNATIIKGPVAEAVAELKQQPGQDLLVFGSGQLVRTLMPHHLIDEYRLMVHPLIAGSGKRLFPEESAQTLLRLVETKPFRSGVVALTYQPAEP